MSSCHWRRRPPLSVPAPLSSIELNEIFIHHCGRQLCVCGSSLGMGIRKISRPVAQLDRAPAGESERSEREHARSEHRERRDYDWGMSRLTSACVLLGATVVLPNRQIRL